MLIDNLSSILRKKKQYFYVCFSFIPSHLKEKKTDIFHNIRDVSTTLDRDNRWSEQITEV